MIGHKVGVYPPKAAGKISSVLDNVQIIKTNNLDISVDDLDASCR